MRWKIDDHDMCLHFPTTKVPSYFPFLGKISLPNIENFIMNMHMSDIVLTSIKKVTLKVDILSPSLYP